MKPEEINRVIAESVGWIEHVNTGLPTWWHNPNDNSRTYKCPLNYFGDLNAIHEVEMSLSKEQYVDFSNHLVEITVEATPMGPVTTLMGGTVIMPKTMARFYSSTAPQRCEAYLKTIGKWVEEKKGEG